MPIAAKSAAAEQQPSAIGGEPNTLSGDADCNRECCRREQEPGAIGGETARCMSADAEGSKCATAQSSGLARSAASLTR